MTFGERKMPSHPSHSPPSLHGNVAQPLQCIESLEIQSLWIIYQCCAWQVEESQLKHITMGSLEDCCWPKCVIESQNPQLETANCLLLPFQSCVFTNFKSQTLPSKTAAHPAAGPWRWTDECFIGMSACLSAGHNDPPVRCPAVTHCFCLCSSAELIFSVYLQIWPFFYLYFDQIQPKYSKTPGWCRLHDSLLKATNTFQLKAVFVMVW